MNFRDEKRKKTEEIEQILKAYLPVQEGKQQVIMEAMEYSLMAGGKRLRPMLLWETFRMFGGAAKTVRPFMAAIEMIHTYSLVHDDLPAMDDMPLSVSVFQIGATAPNIKSRRLC